MEKRALVVALILALGVVVIAGGSRSERVPPRESFAAFPSEIGPWHVKAQTPLAADELGQLRLDEYVNRDYGGPAGSVVGLYIGYYASQRQGQTMHSPLNCLPGAGWEPMKKERVSLPVTADGGGAARTVAVNRLTIQRGLEREVVVYWYQSHGRVEAGEYWGKVFTVLDAIRLNRTDAAMVRVVAPVTGGDAAAEQAAGRQAMAFAEALFPLLARFLPS